MKHHGFQSLCIMAFAIIAIVTATLLGGCYVEPYYPGYGYRHHHHGWRH